MSNHEEPSLASGPRDGGGLLWVPLLSSLMEIALHINTVIIEMCSLLGIYEKRKEKKAFWLNTTEKMISVGKEK